MNHMTLKPLWIQARHLNRTLNCFWKRWKHEYLVELHDYHCYHQGIPNTVSVSVGDVVVIHSDDQPRGFWKRGRVEETLNGPDGEPRGAVLRVTGKGSSVTRLCRPIQRFYPLEVTESETGVKVGPPINGPPTEDNSQELTVEGNTNHIGTPLTPPAMQPRRAAALAARDRL